VTPTNADSSLLVLVLVLVSEPKITRWQFIGKLPVLSPSSTRSFSQKFGLNPACEARPDLTLILSWSLCWITVCWNGLLEFRRRENGSLSWGACPLPTVLSCLLSVEVILHRVVSRAGFYGLGSGSGRSVFRA